MSVEYDSSRFLIDGPHPSDEFHHVYNRRIEQIAPSIIEGLPKPVVSHINQIGSNENCSFVAVVYKKLAQRTNILDSYRLLGGDSQEVVLQSSDTDKLYAEDSTGRIQLCDIDALGIPTGVVLGLHGFVAESRMKFHVISVHLPTINPPPPIGACENTTICFVSNLAVNAEDCDMKALRNFAMAVKQCGLVVVLGNSFAPNRVHGEDEMMSFQARMQSAKWPIQKLESFLATLRVTTVLLPGVNDPCSERLPQMPYHRCLLKSTSIVLATNPAEFGFGGRRFLCGAGESPADLTKVTNLSFHDAQKRLLDWCHYAPTCPEDIPGVALTKKDLLVLDQLPNVFVCGLADEFKASDHNGVTVISVPSFASTKSAVFYDLATGEASSRCFSEFQ